MSEIDRIGEPTRQALDKIEREKAKYLAEDEADLREFWDEKYIRVFCDYTADGVWDKEGCAFLATELPLSAEVIWKLRDWQAWYNSIDFLDNPFTNASLKKFSQAGFEIAMAIKKELPDWEIIYLDEEYADKPRPHREKFSDRSLFEYEITLDMNERPKYRG